MTNSTEFDVVGNGFYEVDYEANHLYVLFKSVNGESIDIYLAAIHLYDTVNKLPSLTDSDSYTFEDDYGAQISSTIDSSFK